MFGEIEFFYETLLLREGERNNYRFHAHHATEATSPSCTSW